GLELTALDLSQAMIERVTAKAEAAGHLSLTTRVADWKDLPLKQNHDIVLAACFPDAFSPEGVSRMEALSKNRCILILGRGKETFPLRQRIWDQLMDVPCPLPRFHLECAPAYLKAIGREPKILNYDFPVTLEVGIDDITTYFTAYFNLFGLREAEIKPVVRKVVTPFSSRNRVTVSGEASLAFIVWWPNTGTGGHITHV
ncbi:MAG: class I SAM-dependent methyltransferase, partial [Candidatus Electrothrix sp. EH2]|nr:class I SAM-dependent methyltransferase [Candidatus Electrothrix sp. EH2]